MLNWDKEDLGNGMGWRKGWGGGGMSEGTWEGKKLQVDEKGPLTEHEL